MEGNVSALFVDDKIEGYFMIRKISGTRSYILVEFDDCKTLKIEGELTLTPAFYAEKNSIKNWESPHQELEISEMEKTHIMEQILLLNNQADTKVKVLFDN